MTKKLLLIDGSSMLVTSFFGNVTPDYYKTGNTSKLMKTSDGRFTNGVYTMSKILLNIIKKIKPTHMAIAWDVNREDLHRKTKYDGYKAHRPETKEELGSQFGLMQELLREMNIPQFRVRGHEADDIIGTFSRKFEKEIPTYIMTKDQDALQLITENTRVWLVTSKAKDMYLERGLDIKTLQLPDGVFEYTPLTFEEEYGISPIQMIDKKALEGDSSDNIPGVKGVGPAAVVPLLKEYGSIEAIYEAIETIPEKELKTFFKEELGISRSPIANLTKESETELTGKKAAFLSKELATIKTDMEEYKDLNLSELELQFDKEKAKKKFEELEFKSLVEKL